MKVKIIILTLLLSFNSFSQLVTNDSLNILFLGNSYTHMNNMPAIFEHIAKSKGKLVHVEKNTQSGASFKVHTGRLDMFQTATVTQSSIGYKQSDQSAAQQEGFTHIAWKFLC